ncbi:MAG: hypothetical protein IPJ54_18725 [Saprospiraceae bacterium]|nr:hypothetical protein [Saprospiraceae bacterium]
MTVVQFRRTLEDVLKTTFEPTYTEVKMSNTFSQNGISLVLVKVKPDWNKKSFKTLDTGPANNPQTTTNFELESKYPIRQLYTQMAKKWGNRRHCLQ